MTDAVPFQFEDHAVRIRDRDGQPWFVAADVCAVLNISKHRDAVARLEDDETSTVIVDSRQNIPFKTRRSSTRFTPRTFVGSKGWITDHSKSVGSNRAISISLLGKH